MRIVRLKPKIVDDPKGMVDKIGRIIAIYDDGFKLRVVDRLTASVDNIKLAMSIVKKNLKENRHYYDIHRQAKEERLKRKRGGKHGKKRKKRKNKN